MMKLSALLLMGITTALLAAPSAAQDKENLPGRERSRESHTKIVKLQKERIAILMDLVEQLTQLYQTGRVDVDAMLEARVQLLQAQRDAAEKPSDRLTLLKNLVEALAEYEQSAEGRVAAGRGTRAAVLKIKARRLEAEIQLEKARAEEPDGPHRDVKVSKPQFKNVTITQQYVCQICAQRHIRICALQKGYIETIAVNEGQSVSQGDVIFKIAPGPYKARLDAALVEVQAAELELHNAEKLFQSNVISSNDLALHKAKLAKAQAQAEQARAELGCTVVKAPFDGIIDRLQKQQGSLINEGEALTTLSDNSAMRVYFNVPEARYLEFMARKDNVQARKIELVLANGSTFLQSGTFSAIEAQFNSDTGAIPFRADFPNPEHLLRHGMSGIALVHMTLNDALVVPQRATFELRDKRYVYVVDRDGVAHRRAVVVRNEVDDNFVIAHGIGGDDQIVVEGIQQVRDGEAVEYEDRTKDKVPGAQAGQPQQ